MKKSILLIIVIFSISISNAQIRKVKTIKKSRIDHIERPISNTQSATNLRQDCCPPWNEEIIKDNTRIVTSPYGGINANYTVKFNATATLRNQMQAYLNYAHAMNPSINAIIIAFKMYKQGPDTCDGGYGPQVGNQNFVTWHANNSVGYQGGNFWTGYNLEVGIWYRLHTGIYLNDGNIFFDNDCANNDICVRIQIKSGMPMLQTNVNGVISEEKISKKSRR